MQEKIEGKAFFKDNASDWEYASEGITRKFIGYNPYLMLVKVKFEKGAIGKLHAHFHTQGSYVASGRFKITIEGKDEILETGDGFFCTAQYRTRSRMSGSWCLDRYF